MNSSDLPGIPVFRPAISEDEIEAVCATLRSGWIGSGPKTAAFEQEFAAFAGVQNAVATGSGTGALMACLAVLRVGPGDEVIIPSFTWPSIFQVIRTLGAEPIFADIEDRFLTLDPADVKRRITPRTRGIVAVHHGGNFADIDALDEVARSAGLWVIYDAAHASGSVDAKGRRAGSQGIATCFSFNAVKNLAAGDGGMVTTNDSAFAQAVREFTSLGLDTDTFTRYGTPSGNLSRRIGYGIVRVGQRLHMNDIAASIAQVQLRRLPELNRLRAERAARYREALTGLAGLRMIEPEVGSQPSHHMFTVLMTNRDTFINEMKERRIAVGIHYPPIHLFPIAAQWASSLPVTEDIGRRTCTLPLYPTMTDEEQKRVITAMKELCGSKLKSHAQGMG